MDFGTQPWTARCMRCQFRNRLLSLLAPCPIRLHHKRDGHPPNSAHFASLAVCVLSSAASDAAPALAPAADKTLEFSGETTEMSKAAGFPRFIIIKLNQNLIFSCRIQFGIEIDKFKKLNCSILILHVTNSIQKWLSLD